MSLLQSRVAAAVTVAVALAILTGCGGGSKRVTVAGKVVVPQKVKLADTDSITVTFTPEAGGTAPGGSATVSPKDDGVGTMVTPALLRISTFS